MENSKLLLCYYGDDFTGSTDSMESLALSGVRTVLFLSPPDPQWLKERFPYIQCFGVAGISRSQTPSSMEVELRGVFERLKDFQTPIIHYKVCSTFDSSVEVGNIGKVIRLGKEYFPGTQVVPLLVGAPALRRYTLFGQHFATLGEQTYRLDRHPVMSKHPVTPMHESDLRLILHEQAGLRVGLMDILDLEGEDDQVFSRLEFRMQEEPDVMLFDVLDQARLKKAGKLIHQQSKHAQTFVVGSSGIQYALMEYWKSAGVTQSCMEDQKEIIPVDQILVVSGSCSPVSKQQMEWAMENGFIGIRVPTLSLMDPKTNEETKSKLQDEVLKVLNAKSSCILYTALGPDDPAVGLTHQSCIGQMWGSHQVNEMLGRQLGQLIREVICESGIRRLVIAGGDTSSHAVRELGLYALELAAPLDPGVPLCRAYSEDERFDGLEIALKGGQMGRVDFFGKVLRGKS